MTHFVRRFSVVAAMAVTSALVFAACASEPRSVSTDSSQAVATTTVPGPLSAPMHSPDTFKVVFETSKGSFTVAVTRELAPLSADRFYEMAKVGYFNEVRFFRLVPGFITQFGIHGDPAVYEKWNAATFPDEPMRVGNTRGTVAFATAGPNTRNVQLFISTGDNRQLLDSQGSFAPFGTVVEGMDVVDSLNAEYGEEPNQSRLAQQGNEYLMRWFPALDYIKSATLIEGPESSSANMK